MAGVLLRGRRGTKLMAKRTDKAAARKRSPARRGSGAGKGRHTRARPAQPAQRAHDGGPALVTAKRRAVAGTARSAATSGPVDVTALTVRELAELLGVGF